MRSLLLLIFSLSFMACHPLKRIAVLPTILNENSGMLCIQDTIWLHNDSGGAAVLYAYLPEKGIVKQLKIKGARNIDWEDLTQNEKGEVFIGDFGNNRNQRRNLCIYKIPNPNQISSDSVQATKIMYTYENQTAFPPPNNQLDFDVEAMVAFRDSLYVFTKNRTKPNNGYIKQYVLPQQAGTHQAILQDSFKIRRGSFLKSITSASISRDGKTLALLSMGKLRLFSNFEGAAFFTAQKKKIYNLRFSQKEAVTFKDPFTIYLSDEKSYFGRAKIYQFKLKPKTKK